MTVATDIHCDDQQYEAAPLICSLAQVESLRSADGRSHQAGSLRQVGGKAWHLSTMLRNGFPVISGFVVTNAAFQKFLDFNQLRTPIATLVEQINLQDTGSLRNVSASIRKLVEGARLPDDLGTALLQSWRQQLPGKMLIVRSSAVGEDSQQASFAGQLDSILNVQSEGELASALLACWASYWSDRSLFYQHGRGITLDGMGVLIQEQAKSAVSGVMFTVSPDAADSIESANRVTVEFCRGLGAALVSGEINPGRLSVARDDCSDVQLTSSGDELADAIMQKPAVVAALTEWGLKSESLFGGPQDMEWTIDEDGRLFVLQSRGITVPPAAAGRISGAASNTVSITVPNAESTNAEGQQFFGRMVLWSNANVNENFPDPICPLLYSVASTGYYHYFRNLGKAIGLSRDRIDAMERSLRQIIGVHGARMYYNLTNIHACLRMAPRGERLTELFNNFVGADRIAATPDHPDWQKSSRGRVGQLFELCRIATTVVWRALWLTKGVEDFEATVDQFAEATTADAFQNASLADLLIHVHRFIDIRSHRWVKASLADAAAMLSYGLLKRTLNKEFPDEDLASLHNTLLKGLPDLASNRPVVGLWRLSREIQGNSDLYQFVQQHDGSQIWNALQQRSEFSQFRNSFQRFLDECGFRCSGELMLTVPSFQENPAALIEILKAYLNLKGDSPAERLLEQERHRIDQTAQLMTTLSKRSWFRFLPWPTKALKTRLLLKWTQASIALRERARLKQALLYSRFRQVVLAIGRRLAATGLLTEPDDIFFLTHAEIVDLLSGGSMFPQVAAELIRLRKHAHQRMSKLHQPDTFELPEGASFETLADVAGCVDDRTGDLAGTSQVSGVSDSQLTGIGACGGSVTARAAVLQDVSEFSLLSQGDILVTRQTDPGWGPLFFLIRGLVIERGGMLSHGAILAREYGIPTVVGVLNATQRIKHGQTLTVNGDRGLVELAND